ncbi:MAG: energy transducer TonB, partial [Gammaproteobacteria bacterium]
FYPARSRRRGEEGKVLLTLRIGRDGTLQETELNTSSGHRRLDRAALRTIERLGKAPPLPKEWPDETLEVEIPIRFQLRD